MVVVVAAAAVVLDMGEEVDTAVVRTRISKNVRKNPFHFHISLNHPNATNRML